MIITIDGPAASGKSTVAYIIAKRLSLYYINSGFLFRALSYVFLYEYGLNETALVGMPYQEAKELYFGKKIIYKYTPESGACVFFNKVNITAYLKDIRVEQGASIVARNEAVRPVILEYQRFIADNHDVIIEGRDAGTNVFPNANLKFFVTASTIERAKRWQKSNKLKNIIISFQDSLNFIQERDRKDKSRSIAPLAPAVGTIIIDNTGLSANQTADVILQYIHNYKNLN
ncbi:MAG: (d)CMP kinase [Novosphingobium sp.]|nr:(d)CMP kinase [Novosphingobium sp.]